MSLINERDWAAKTAMRLRVVQASMAECEAENDRGVAVWEFIAQALGELGDLSERQRIQHLRALDEAFPFYEARLVVTREEQGAPVVAEQPATGGPEPALTPDELVQKLVEAAKSFEAAEIERLTKLLTEGGLRCEAAPAGAAAGRQSGLPVVLPAYQEEIVRLTRTVGKIHATVGREFFKSADGMHVNRCLQILGLMCEQFLLLHPQIWALWEGIVTNHQYTTSFNRPSLPAARALAEFFEGETSARRADVGQMVAKTFHLVTALVSSVGEASQEFASWFFEKFGPENIESVINFETNGEKPGPAQYWKRYQELAGLNNADELREQFHNLLGKNMLRNIQRRGGI